MKLILSSDQSKFIESNSELVPLASHQRMKRAFKAFGIFFGLALISIFIPVLHFVLVPVFLVLSLGAAFKSYKAQHQLQIDSQCAECGAQMKSTSYLNSDSRIKCEQCPANYLIGLK